MKAQHYTAWGDIVETFWDIPIVSRSSGHEASLAITGGSNAKKCFSGYKLYEVTSKNKLSGVLEKEKKFMVEDINNTFYCLPNNSIKDASLQNDTIDAAAVVQVNGNDYTTNDYAPSTDVCNPDSFLYHGSCIKTNVVNISKEVERCLLAPLHIQPKVCGDIDVDTLVEIYHSLPKPIYGTTPSNDYIIENKTSKGTAYCPTTHPILIDENLYAHAVCGHPDTFGLVFNKYCDQVSKIPCKLRLR